MPLALSFRPPLVGVLSASVDERRGCFSFGEGAMASTSDADASDLESIRRKLIKRLASNWEEVVKIYEQDPRAHKIKIGPSKNTALHIAVSKNRDRSNPLHPGVSLGSISMCRCITGEYKELLGCRNRVSDTPLLRAVRYGRKDVFLSLYDMCDTTSAHDYCHDMEGKKVLHLAIEGGHMGKSKKHLDPENPEEGQGIELHGHNSSNIGAQGHKPFPSKYGRCQRFIKLLVSQVLLVIISVLPGSSRIRKLKEKKEMHVWSLQIMDKLLEHAARRTDEINPNCCYSEYEYFRRGGASETPILLASRNGIVEMVEKILQLFPMAIYDTNGFNQIIVLTAIENRQSHIYDFLLNSSHLIDKEGAFVDKGGNSALHLLEV
ncbi:hypothetical protein CK203_083609 [Vitis vinifera]|uniref:Uncharacterized protein n=1 Tax=Vitis vinifera TaxID=29760 RepID=A0A438BS78_VITVI|nr:hypothetical protein CK203_083609 [Vitis vinifera]